MEKWGGVGVGWNRLGVDSHLGSIIPVSIYIGCRVARLAAIIAHTV